MTKPPESAMQALLKIGELAARFSVTPDTIRYYEKHHLIRPRQRSESGYRLYDADNQVTLEFILNAKSIGFTLQEIKYLLQVEENKARYSCAEVKHFIEDKRTRIQLKLAKLHQVEATLAELSASCDGGHDSAEQCPIMDGIETGI